MQYQALYIAGVDAKLDVCEAMWHVIQEDNWNIPEALIVHLKMAKFPNDHMRNEE